MRDRTHLLQPAIQSLKELQVKNQREIDWKLKDVEQWEEEIAKALEFVGGLEEREASINQAINALEGIVAGNVVGGIINGGEDSDDCQG